MIKLSEVLSASILIVDDQESNVILLEKLLASAGYTNISSTKNPRAVCAMHMEHSYDLILLDLQMPEMDGFQVMEGIKEIEKNSYSPVLVVTAQPEHKLRALKAGAKDFISKPIEALELKTRIHNMLEVRLLYKKLESYNELLEKKVIERTAQLHASEARFKNFTELTSDWYWEQDAVGKFTTVSGPVFEMLGIETDDNNEFLPEEWNQEELATLKYNIATRRPFLDFIYSLKKPSGKTQRLQVSGEPMFDTSSRFIGYRGVGVEITDQHYAYRKESNFRKAIDVINLGICLINPITFELMDTNETMCQMSGFNRAELLTLTLPALMVALAQDLAKVFATVIAHEPHPASAAQLRCKDETLLPVQADYRCMNDDGNAIIVATFGLKTAS
ncbi:response regulator [Sapientia aquatica]|uniref:Response regulator n=1 Tax=Sapientia aquatica TaxID=1549640 RepID=A0A4R5W533_9BURK|nr:response regulator [Sapientia aquatica]TDK67106.1 response regulator [Sapientia aquatica]